MPPTFNNYPHSDEEGSFGGMSFLCIPIYFLPFLKTFIYAIDTWHQPNSRVPRVFLQEPHKGTLEVSCRGLGEPLGGFPTRGFPISILACSLRKFCKVLLGIFLIRGFTNPPLWFWKAPLGGFPIGGFAKLHSFKGTLYIHTYPKGKLQSLCKAPKIETFLLQVVKMTLRYSRQPIT